MPNHGYNWQDEKEIDRFAEEWRESFSLGGLSMVGDSDPIIELRKRWERGDFSGKNRTSVERYLKRAEAKAHSLSAAGQAEREERAVKAAESSAKWAGWAVAISIAAFALSAWPYLKPAA